MKKDQFFSENLNEEVVGDVNFDQSINIIDLVQISDSMADDLNYYYLFDFNLDHEINGSDIFALATYILGF